MNAGQWRAWIDTGGTFTDCVAVDPAGGLHRAKILSSGALRGVIESVIDDRTLRVDTPWSLPRDFIRGFTLRLLESGTPAVEVERYDEVARTIALASPLATTPAAGAAFEARSREAAPVLAARLAMGVPVEEPLPAIAMRLATTRGTNALLERSGARVAFFVTAGFGDLLRIGNQQRPDLFALEIRKSDPLYEVAVEVPERIAADGKIVVPLDEARVREQIEELVAGGYRHAAVTLINSYANPQHEKRVAELLLKNGFAHVSVSTGLAPFIKVLPRAETTVVDAFLAPVIDDYIEEVRKPLGRGSLHVMTSAGGMMRPESYRAKDSLLSGPAGGVVGAALAGRRAGFERIIAFDMGGTSTDVARFDGDLDYSFEHVVGDAHLVAPALAIESVAAGGGSICHYDGVTMGVGPKSAGADPGPACYGAGGPLTLTDVNLLAGRLDPRRFEIPIDRDAARRAFDNMVDAIARVTGDEVDGAALLDGLLQIADERMAEAIRRISIRKGYDPAAYALVAFGGAGAQHACGVADRLGITTIVIPPDASLLSAFGLGAAAMERFAERQVLHALDEVTGSLDALRSELEEEARALLVQEGVSDDDIEVRRTIASLRIAGQESSLQVDVAASTGLAEAFRRKYEAVFGYWPAGRSIELESLRVVASARTEDVDYTQQNTAAATRSDSTTRAWFEGSVRDVPVTERAGLKPGEPLAGPALVFEAHTVTVVAPGWSAAVGDGDALVLRRAGEVGTTKEHPEPVRLELFTHRFESIAREMGETLRRTALSTNVKERLDFSCALLDAAGDLIVNAPHIPVHLGALGLCVKSVCDAIDIAPGDVIVTNHPAFGGSHLPDVTVITPVHGAGGTLLAFTASRAHHAEIGGSRPGSMPADATTLAEEGVVIPPTHLFKAGVERWDEVRALLSGAALPSRAVNDNIADLRAAVAANRAGADALLSLAGNEGEETIRHFMALLEDVALAKVSAALERLPDGTYEATETMDDGSRLCVRVDVAGARARIDFTGTSGRHAGNLNATPAVVRSVVLYVLRLLIREPFPLNEGIMKAITIELPEGMLNPHFPRDPRRAPAVVGGNVETSQRLAGCIIKALRLMSGSQATMNNVVFGTDRYSYYETIGGGAGAGADFEGASAVHTHMTNTLITDPEVLERRYPVRLDSFTIRRGSGGGGTHSGGDGAIREMTFLEPMSLSVLGQHRNEGPFALEGGERGKPARVYVQTRRGKHVELGSSGHYEVRTGDRLVIETPGGSGYGPPDPKH